MLDRLKSAARQKLQRAVAEAVEDEHAHTRQCQQHLHAELLAAIAALDSRLDDEAARTTEVLRRQDELEFRARRDLWYAQDLRVTQESAAFITQHLPKASVFWDPHDTLRFALSEITGPGMALEFGVATGTTLTLIAEAVADDRLVAGFDVFSGLPETWRTGFPSGQFAQAPPDIPDATMVVGLFEDTLPAFLAEHDEPIAFLHLDADLYTSTKTVFDLAGDRLGPAAVVLFDEFFNYPGWQQHEFRALSEFIDRTGRTVEYLGYTGNNEQVALRLL